MKILMLVNWNVAYTRGIPQDKQPPDYVAEGQPYWFFRYFAGDTQVDVADVHSFPFLEHFEKEKLRFYIWQTLRVLPKLRHYDLVLSHGMQSGIVLCLFRRLFGKGRCKHVVFDIGAFNSAKESGRALKLMQFASKSLDGVIYHTSAQKSYYEKCHPWLTDKSRFIPFGADPEYFQSTEPSEQGMQPYILCIGHNKRDWDTLLAAFAGVDTPVHLRLLGNEKLLSDDPRVEVRPAVSAAELKRQIAGSLFGVLPLESFRYSFGQMTLLQQMAMSKAVIAADVPSLRDYVTDGETAVLYPPKDADALADCMRKLLQDSALCTRIGQQAMQSVSETYNERNMAAEIEKFLQEIMNA